MQPHTRAIIAASAFAFVTGKKVAGLYDHTAGRDLQIAADIRGDQLQGYDGERAVSFGGAATELYDGGDKAFISVEVEGTKMRGYDRGSSGAYEAQVTGGLVQVFDHSAGAWFAYDIQDAGSAQSYLRA
jgi:hypothetical protein